MTAQQLINICHIRLVGDDQLEARLPKGLSKTEKTKLIADLKATKPEVIAILKAETEAKENAYQDREKAIAGIEGLTELKKAINAERAYHKEFNRRMEDEGLSSFPPNLPKVKSSDIAAQYPRAAAYIKAEAWTMASNSAKYSAGKKALERIINGEDYTQVITDMDTEWSNYCNEHIWD